MHPRYRFCPSPASPSTHPHGAIPPHFTVSAPRPLAFDLSTGREPLEEPHPFGYREARSKEDNLAGLSIRPRGAHTSKDMFVPRRQHSDRVVSAASQQQKAASEAHG